MFRKFILRLILFYLVYPIQCQFEDVKFCDNQYENNPADGIFSFQDRIYVLRKLKDRNNIVFKFTYQNGQIIQNSDPMPIQSVLKG